MSPPDGDRSREIEGLDESGGDEPEGSVRFWERKQRELLTSQVDFNLGTLSDLVTQKQIDLSPKYQRRDRWDETRQSRLIESFLMNVPVPAVFLNEDKYGRYSVIDGKQRLTAVNDFLRGRLKLRGLQVFSEINGKTFDDLAQELQNVIRVRPLLRTVIVLKQSDEDVKFEVFRRLNTGGIRLNAQEIRNSTYPGPFNDMILELSENEKFHNLLGIASTGSSTMYQEMRDVELVLRYLTFRETWSTFSGGMMSQLDHFMAAHQSDPPEQLSMMHADFLTTIDAVEAGFGHAAFRRWNPARSEWRRQILAALFDAQMFASRGLDPTILGTRRDTLVEGMKILLTTEEFSQSIDAATNTPSFFKKRIQLVHNLLHFETQV